MSSLTGKRLTFQRFRQDDRWETDFPVSGTILKRVVVSQEKNWLLVQLDQAICFDSQPAEAVLIKSKDSEVVKPGSTNQLVHFRLVPQITQVMENNQDANQFPFVDWVWCQ